MPLEFTNTDFEPDFTASERTVLRRIAQMIVDSVDLDLDDLGDVDAAAPNDGDLLYWNEIEEVWEPGPVQVAGNSGSYTPTLNDELNANASAIIGIWHYINIGTTVICTVRLDLDSNASGGDYRSQLSFNLPVATANPSSLAGTINAVDTVEGVGISGKIYRGLTAQTAQAANLIEVYFPANVGAANFYGTFMYSTV